MYFIELIHATVELIFRSSFIVWPSSIEAVTISMDQSLQDSVQDSVHKRLPFRDDFPRVMRRLKSFIQAHQDGVLQSILLKVNCE